jgi:hypothetical protein
MKSYQFINHIITKFFYLLPICLWPSQIKQRDLAPKAQARKGLNSKEMGQIISVGFFFYLVITPILGKLEVVDFFRIFTHFFNVSLRLWVKAF